MYIWNLTLLNIPGRIFIFLSNVSKYEIHANDTFLGVFRNRGTKILFFSLSPFFRLGYITHGRDRASLSSLEVDRLLYFSIPAHSLSISV